MSSEKVWQALFYLLLASPLIWVVSSIMAAIASIFDKPCESCKDGSCKSWAC